MLRTAWTYVPVDAPDIVELGTVQGRDVALPAHFHDEDQVTFVLSGRRRFVLGHEIVAIEPGQCVLIPAGVAHRSLAEPSDVACLNIYMAAGVCAFDAMSVAAQRLWRRTGTLSPTALTAVIRAHRLPQERISQNCSASKPSLAGISHRGGCAQSVATLAARSGMSREGFSRAFTRDHGMSPHAFGIVARLNHARRLLRLGEGLAAAAADTGFVDQSHFGRCFRRAFGVTPGVYRGARSRSQTYQTD